MKKIWLLLPEEIVEYLEKRFRTTDASLDAYIADLIRAEMAIDVLTPKTETSSYRFIRKKTKELSDIGTELTAQLLAEWGCRGAIRTVQMARDYLARMAADGFVKLVRRDAHNRKVYAWNAGKNPE